jgi:hypothetical protein
MSAVTDNDELWVYVASLPMLIAVEITKGISFADCASGRNLGDYFDELVKKQVAFKNNLLERWRDVNTEEMKPYMRIKDGSLSYTDEELDAWRVAADHVTNTWGIPCNKPSAQLISMIEEYRVKSKT